MGAGYHGGFGNTIGAIAGDATFRSDPYDYFKFISRRSDIDKDGVFDVVAHGAVYTIQIMHNGEIMDIDSRLAARLIQQNSNYKKGQSIRLLSCNTGESPNGFAQNLANKLNVVVYAPTNIVWAYPNGRHIVAARRGDNDRLPDLKKLGSFIPFYPGGNKNGKSDM